VILGAFAFEGVTFMAARRASSTEIGIRIGGIAHPFAFACNYAYFPWSNKLEALYEIS